MNLFPAIAGVALDQLAGEPAAQWHPVAGFGTLMNLVEQHIYADRRLTGAAFATIGVGAGITTGVVLRALFGPAVATVVATGVCSAGKMLDREDRGALGDGPPPSSATITEAIRLRRHAVIAMAALLTIIRSLIHIGRRAFGRGRLAPWIFRSAW